MEDWERYKYDQARAWLKEIKDMGDSLATSLALIKAEQDLADGVGAIDYSKEYRTTRMKGSVKKALR